VRQHKIRKPSLKRFADLRSQEFFIRFLIPRQEAFLSSFLLAHCGGGQDKPGCLGPSAKLPRRFFSFTSLSKKVLYFLASRWPPEVLQAPLLFNFQLSTSVVRSFSSPFSNF
jgi:hypothetical protein